MTKYIVRLSEQEREHLTSLVRKGKVVAYKRMHAQVLLNCDEGEQGPAMSDQEVADALSLAKGTPRNIRKRFVEKGFEAALGRKKQENPSRLRLLDGKAEARLIAVACSSPPKGRAKWTLRMLADKLVALDVVETISTNTVMRTLKKTSSDRT